MIPEEPDCNFADIPVVYRVGNPHHNAAFVLRQRAQQLDNLIYALKQYIHFIRKGYQVSAFKAKDARKHILFTNDKFLAKDGSRLLLEQLIASDRKMEDLMAESVQTYLPQTVRELSIELREVEQILSKGRLGKAHKQREENVEETASKLNELIAKLEIACVVPEAPSPYSDPVILWGATQVKMAEYLARENNYKNLCLAEQDALLQLEGKLFKILEQIPIKHGEFVTALMEKYNDCLGEEKRVEDLADWGVFETEYKDTSLQQIAPLVLSQDNHPSDEFFNCFEVFRIENLEIYHTVSTPPHNKLPRASTILGLGKDYAVRGSWSISAAGYFTEFDDKQHKALSIFDLSICKLGLLVPDEAMLWGYFTLQGRKSHDPADKKKEGRKKDYKFRASWRDAQEVYNRLRGYCEAAD